MSAVPWVFGYGSLVWRPSFEALDARPARLVGYARRFWQGSTDHRGVPGAPGRVVTLVPDEGASTVGMAYRVSHQTWGEVVAGLDHREQGGYDRHEVTLELLADGNRVPGMLYLASPDNPNYLGPAPVEVMVAQIRTSRGPSGPNDEYLLRLAAWLRQIGEEDEHVSELVDRYRSELQ